jgi:hypothetical protein
MPAQKRKSDEERGIGREKWGEKDKDIDSSQQ